MRVIPAEGRHAGEIGVGGGLIEDAGEADLILHREDKRRAGGVLAGNLAMGVNSDRAGCADSEEYTPDFHATARNGIECLDSLDAYLVNQGRRNRYAVRTLAHRP